MALRGTPSLRESLLALGMLTALLLACKKSEPESTASTATAATTEPPAATVAPEPTAPAEPTASATAEPTPTATATATSTVAVKPTTTVKPTDAGVKDAAVVAADAGTATDAGARLSSGADAKVIQACCSKLSAEAAKGGTTANKYKSAAAVCGGLAQRVAQGKADAASVKTLIRAQLQGVPVPAGC